MDHLHHMDHSLLGRHLVRRSWGLVVVPADNDVPFHTWQGQGSCFFLDGIACRAR